MKTRQFIILLIAIFLQPVICYCWFGAWLDPLYRNQVKFEQGVVWYTELRDTQYTITERLNSHMNWLESIYDKCISGLD